MAVKMKYQGRDVLLMTRQEYDWFKDQLERPLAGSPSYKRASEASTDLCELASMNFRGMPIYILEDEVRKVKHAVGLWQRLIELLHQDVRTLVKLPNWLDKLTHKKYGDWRDDHG